MPEVQTTIFTEFVLCVKCHNYTTEQPDHICLICKEKADENTIQERFNRFHAEHPEVYGKLVELAHTAKNQGRRKIGIGMLFEVLRWNDVSVRTQLSNDFRSRYARLIMEQEPGLAGIFDTRPLRSK